MKIHAPQLNKIIEANSTDSLFTQLRKQDVPVASSCLGDGICGKCRLNILNGSENLSPIGILEAKLIEKYQLTSQQRISCQCTMNGDVVVSSSYW